MKQETFRLEEGEWQEAREAGEEIVKEETFRSEGAG